MFRGYLCYITLKTHKNGVIISLCWLQICCIRNKLKRTYWLNFATKYSAIFFSLPFCQMSESQAKIPISEIRHLLYFDPKTVVRPSQKHEKTCSNKFQKQTLAKTVDKYYQVKTWFIVILCIWKQLEAIFGKRFI